MKMQVIKAYLSIVESGSFAAAARRQHISQPAISMMIASLEEELGQKLFLRSQGQHGRIRLTPSGEIFRDYAYKYLNDYESMRIALVQNRKYSSILVATSPTPGSTLLPVLLQAFKNDYPQIPCMVQAYPGRDLLNCLRQRQCDLYITGYDPQEPDIICEPFFYDPLELVCPVSMDIDRSITSKQFQKLPLIIRNLNCNTTRLLLSKMEGIGLQLEDLNVVLQVYGNADVLQAVAFGSGAGFVTRSLLITNPEYCQKVHTVSVKHLSIPRHLYLVRLRDETLSPSAQVFWDYALDLRWRKGLFRYDTSPI